MIEPSTNKAACPRCGEELDSGNHTDPTGCIRILQTRLFQAREERAVFARYARGGNCLGCNNTGYRQVMTSTAGASAFGPCNLCEPGRLATRLEYLRTLYQAVVELAKLAADPLATEGEVIRMAFNAKELGRKLEIAQ